MYELAKRKQGDGRIVIDKKRSFMLFSETMRDEYESIVLDESPDLLNLKFESFLSACAEGQHDEDTPDLLLKAVAFYVLDSEYQDFGRAAELMRITVELLDAPEGLCLLGLFNYLMPDQTQEDIESSVRCFRKAELGFLEQGGDNHAATLLEEISSFDEDFASLYAAIDGGQDARQQVVISGSNAKTVVKKEEGGGAWVAVTNVALGVLSKVSAEKLNDPVFMRKTLGKAYGLLPFWVKLAVSEDLFFNFCFDRRAYLIDRIGSGVSSVELCDLEADHVLPLSGGQPEVSKDVLMINVVEKYSGKFFSEEKFYFLPAFGSEKFKNACDSYVMQALDKHGLAPAKKGFLSSMASSVVSSGSDLSDVLGTPLFMYDSTVFGSCKAGFVVTSRYLIVKDAMEKPVLIRLEHIDSVEIRKSFMSAGKLYVNDQSVIDCVQGKKDSFKFLPNMLDEIIDIVR